MYLISRGFLEFFTEETRINGGGRRSIGYLKVGKMTVGVGRNFLSSYASMRLEAVTTLP